MDLEEIKDNAKSQGLELCEKEIVSIKKEKSIPLCHWYEGRAHGIILTMYKMGLLNYECYSKENLNIIQVAAERRNKLLENDKSRKVS